MGTLCGRRDGGAGGGGAGIPGPDPAGKGADPQGLLQNKALNSAPFLPFKAEHRVNFSCSRLCERNRGPGMGWGNGGRAPPPLGTEQGGWHDHWGPAAAGDGSFTSIAPASPPGQDTHPPALPPTEEWGLCPAPTGASSVASTWHHPQSPAP